MINSNKIKSVLGATVKELRKRKGITQEQLAEYLDLQPQSITTIETGRTFISSEVLASLCNYFEVAPSIFFTQKVNVLSEEDTNYLEKIKNILPVYNTERLRDIYHILLALQK